MLQFIAETNDNYSIPEQAQMAIEGGCAWVQLRLGDMPDEQIRELCAELVPLCKETSTILVIENHIELARELGLHGVHLRGSSVSAPAAREMLGPEAILGCEVAQAASALPMQKQDVDYVTFAVGIEKFAECAAALRQSAFTLPIVAEITRSAEDAAAFIAAGASGIAAGATIVTQADSVEATEQLLRSITEK